MFTDPSAFDGASAVLVTHEHADHFAPDRLRAALEADPALEVWTNASVAAQLDGLAGRMHVVGHGDAETIAGFDAHVHGELHAEIHPEIPRIPNIGFLVDGLVFHPGDALTVPDEPVSTLLLPLHAP
jgi:L-ascorbate metabolism protein UlaG (beta-lactamase superfamily)